MAKAEGENATATFGGTVWGDRDGDGMLDADESELPGVSVSLFDPVDGLIGNGNDAQVGVPATTDGSSDYAFTTLVAGSDYVQFAQSAEHALSPDNQGTDDAIDSDANRNPARDPDGVVGRTGVINVACVQVDLRNDAGLLVPDRFEQNDSFANAVLPGVHIPQVTISQPTGQPSDDDFIRSNCSGPTAWMSALASLTRSAILDWNCSIARARSLVPAIRQMTPKQYRCRASVRGRISRGSMEWRARRTFTTYRLTLPPVARRS